MCRGGGGGWGHPFPSFPHAVWGSTSACMHRRVGAVIHAPTPADSRRWQIARCQMGAALRRPRLLFSHAATE